jgi:hypothetical protein
MSSSKVHEKLLEAVLHRAGGDRVFRQQLLASPAAAIRDAYGVALPEGFRIRFIEKSADLDVLAVLPDLASSDEELSDDELEQVAGGDAGTGAWAPPPPPPVTTVP